MSARWLCISALLALPAVVGAQPTGATVIERVQIPPEIRKNRELVLWMVNPVRHDRGPLTPLNGYTCPERTTGSYYSGPTRISLLNSATGATINTVAVHVYKEDSFEVPYRILRDYYYVVPGVAEGKEGRPALLALRDLNGDGLKLETAFFQALACMGLSTALFGYSVKQDKVIQYEARLRETQRQIVEGVGYRTLSANTAKTFRWIDYLLSYPPVAPMRWSYKVDYTGRGGSMNTYDIQYDPRSEAFSGTLMIMMPPWME